MVRLDRPRRTADGDRKRSRRDRDRAPDDGGECRCVGVRARQHGSGDLPRRVALAARAGREPRSERVGPRVGSSHTP